MPGNLDKKREWESQEDFDLARKAEEDYKQTGDYSGVALYGRHPGDAGEEYGPRHAGQFVRRHLDLMRPMGSWTGLWPIYGAPLSGALWGAGIGTALSGAQAALSGKDKKVHWIRNALLGTLAGGGVGLLSGLAQWNASNKAGLAGSMAARLDKDVPLWGFLEKDLQGGHAKQSGDMSDVEEILRILRSDSSLSSGDFYRIESALRASPDYMIGRIMRVLGMSGGAGAGFLVARILGLGLVGQGTSALAGGLLGGRIFGGRTRYI